MNNEINVRTLCTGVKTSEPITKERSHDICQTRLITRRVVKYPHCTPITPSRGTKLWKDAATVRAIGVPNIAPM